MFVLSPIPVRYLFVTLRHHSELSKVNAIIFDNLFLVNHSHLLQEFFLTCLMTVFLKLDL